MTTHTGEVLYTCPHCPKTFNSNANMHAHRKKMHFKEWQEYHRQHQARYRRKDTIISVSMRKTTENAGATMTKAATRAAETAETAATAEIVETAEVPTLLSVDDVLEC